MTATGPGGVDTVLGAPARTLPIPAAEPPVGALPPAGEGPLTPAGAPIVPAAPAPEALLPSDGPNVPATVLLIGVAEAPAIGTLAGNVVPCSAQRTNVA